MVFFILSSNIHSVELGSYILWNLNVSSNINYSILIKSMYSKEFPKIINLTCLREDLKAERCGYSEIFLMGQNTKRAHHYHSHMDNLDVNYSCRFILILTTNLYIGSKLFLHKNLRLLQSFHQNFYVTKGGKKNLPPMHNKFNPIL